MEYEKEFEIDYEDMDDLALPDHIEWNHNQSNEFTMDALEFIYS